jgi:uncharacterized protein (UPF0216 family)
MVRYIGFFSLNIPVIIEADSQEDAVTKFENMEAEDVVSKIVDINDNLEFIDIRDLDDPEW